MGLMYLEGRGLSRNDAEAVKWLRKAAEQGGAYARGEGKKNRVEIRLHDGGNW